VAGKSLNTGTSERALVVEHAYPRRQLRRHVQHCLTRGDKLLRQQRTKSSRTLDGPYPRHICRRELQQPIALMSVSAHPQLADRNRKGP
jgi:hypothetical protein